MKGSMRAVVALVLCAVLFALSWAPHVHHHDARGDHECPACIARNSEAAHYEVPELEPVWVGFVRVLEVAPFEPASTGAPLGSVPGQSPPVNS
jgi:hypothetical protein